MCIRDRFDTTKHHKVGDAICDATDPSLVLTAVPSPPRDGAPVDVRIHYRRDDGNYADWGLHLWPVSYTHLDVYKRQT